MRDYEGRVLNHLVITLGFSRRNAEIAVEMFREGQLNRTEEEVINRIMLNPDYDGIPAAWDSLDDTRPLRVMEHLNYSITVNGGEAITQCSRKR